MFSAFFRGLWTASSTVVSRLCVLLPILVAYHSLTAATLERLTLDDLSNSATAVVRGTISGSRTAMHGSTIYTHYTVQVSEVWKGPAQTSVDVMLPGGIASGVRQTFAGVPQLQTGSEYLMFLWTGKSGNTQPLGLTQGLFDVLQDANGETLVSRGAASELMLDAGGKAVQDQPVRMTMKAMSSKVRGFGTSAVK